MLLISKSRINKEKVLGMIWSPQEDKIVFSVKLNFSKKKQNVYTFPDLSIKDIPPNDSFNINKAQVLAQINSIYDPLGLIAH